MNPPAGSQRIVPYLYYDEPRAALEHLCHVFGFEQTMLLEWPDGGLAHAEVSLGGERVLIGAADARFGLISSAGLNGVHAVICVYVDEIDTHHARAQSCGAEIAQPVGADDLEFQISGRARLVQSAETRNAVLAAIPFPSFNPADPIYELLIERALSVSWPQPGLPVKRSWRAPVSQRGARC